MQGRKAIMKIIALADIHGSDNILYRMAELKEEYSPDVVVIAGDITHFGPASWAEDIVKRIVSMGLVVAGVPGNCDPPEVSSAIEDAGGISLHDARQTIGSVVFAGLGGSNPTPFPTLYWRKEDEMMTALEAVLMGAHVLVSHAPPLGKNDLSMRDGTRVGSGRLAELIRKTRPMVVITGHIHEARGIVEEEGTIYINPGKAADGFAGLVIIDPQTRTAEARLL